MESGEPTTTDASAPAPIEQPPRKPRTLALIGLIVSAVALLGAFGSPWIIDALEPPTTAREIGEVAADIATGFKDRLTQRLSGSDQTTDPMPPARTGRPWTASRWVPLAVVGLGSIGALLGVIGWVLREDRRYVWAAGLLGVAAIGVIWVSTLIAVAIGLILIWIVLTGLGITGS